MQDAFTTTMYADVANEVSPPPSSYKHLILYSNHLIPPAMSNTFTRQALARSKDTLLDDLLQKPGTSDVETYNEVCRVYRNLEKSLITPEPEPLFISNLSRKDVDRIFSSLRNDIRPFSTVWALGDEQRLEVPRHLGKLLQWSLHAYSI